MPEHGVISRSTFRKAISALIKDLHGSGFGALLIRWEASRHPFIKTASRVTPAALYSNLQWLRPAKLSEFEFLVAMLKHMGEGPEDLQYLRELYRVEEGRYIEAHVALMGVFQSVRLTKPVERIVRLFSAKRVYAIVD